MLQKKRNKYGNSKIVDGDEEYDSKRELERHRYLKEMESQGRITNLNRQVKFELIPKVIQNNKTVQQPITYKCDFQYWKEGVEVVEDIKISPKLIPQEYRLKEKLFLWKFGFPIKRVYDPKEEI